MDRRASDCDTKAETIHNQKTELVCIGIYSRQGLSFKQCMSS